MTTGQPTDSGSTPSPTPAGQAGTGTEGQSVQPNSTAETLTVNAEDWRTMQATVKALQSDKDRAAHRNAQSIGDLSGQVTRISELLGQNFTPEQVERELRLDRILNTGMPPAQGDPPPASAPASPASGAVQQNTPNVSAIVSAFGFEQNDPRVAQAMFASGGNVQKLRDDLLTIKIAAQNATVPPAAAAPAAPQGTVNNQNVNTSDLASRLNAALRTGNQKLIDELQTQLDQSGAYQIS